ncbi:hypothetical protein V1477_021080 [Vespula maculifrons]|uniref:Uncharacterized protein n=1 Tax=Vespula maculifrons TaxID=7453 RepID=A0ABD2AH43_VESMC
MFVLWLDFPTASRNTLLLDKIRDELLVSYLFVPRFLKSNIKINDCYNNALAMTSRCLHTPDNYEVSTDVECLVIALPIVEILVSPFDVIRIQISVISDPPQYFWVIGTDFALMITDMDLPYMNKLNKSLATTPTDEILPQTATPYDRANYGGGSRWDESVHSTQFIDSDVMLAVTGLILKNEIKGVPYTSGMESTYRFTLLLGNTINRRVGINSKAIPFERSSCLKLTVIDNNKKEKKEGNIFNGHEDEPSRVPCILAYKTTFERWYDAREYILSKDPMVSSFIRVYNRLRSERFDVGSSDGGRGSWIKVQYLL